MSVVCLSVTLVHPTQAIEIFGNVSTPVGTNGGVYARIAYRLWSPWQRLAWNWFKTGSEREASPHTCQETAAESSARAPVRKC